MSTKREILSDQVSSLERHINIIKVMTSDWVADHYRLFCMSIVQHYIPPPSGEKPETFAKMFDRGNDNMPLSRAKMMSQMSEQEKKELQRKIWEAHEQMMDVFRNIPPPLFLVFRYDFDILLSIFRRLSFCGNINAAAPQVTQVPP